MKKRLKRKIWLDRRSRKHQSAEIRKRHTSSGLKGNSSKKAEKKDVFIAKAPEVFSFIKNTKATIDYFTRIMAETKRKRYKQLFFLDSSEVKSVTTDALVYIIAILYNMKLNHLMRYSFKGNIPNDKEPQKVYLESGFLGYMKTKRAIMPKPDNKIQILSGTKTDPAIAGQVCDFVNLRSDKDYKFTLELYKTLIELMSNTVHHAYNNKTMMEPYWYLYAIDIGESIQFTFIDTGEGVPNTVKKRLLENIPNAITDSELIYSAFLGESRTETGLYNRGHGLPALYEKVMNGELRRFYALSGTGCCMSTCQNGSVKMEKVDYEQEVFGTIFQFEIVKIKEVLAC